MLLKNGHISNIFLILSFFTGLFVFVILIKQTSNDTYKLDAELDEYKREIENDRSSNLILHKTPRRFAVISCNLFSPNYYMFSLPFASLAWRRVGFEPIILLVKSNLTRPTEQTTKTIEYLKKFKIKIVYIESPIDYDLTIGMVSRLFVGLLNDDLISDDDFILTSDSDLFPINENYYNFKTNDDRIIAWNAYCCGSFMHENRKYSMYTTLHVGMRKYQWRQILNLNKSDESNLNGQFILRKTGELLNGNDYIKKNSEIVKGAKAWYLDQTLVTVCIDKYVDKTNTLLKKIHLKQSTRLDRSYTKNKWLRKLALHFESLTDCHSFQHDVFQNWQYMQPLFLKMFNHKIKIIFDQYFYEYTNLKSFKSKN